jgi:hypothetical protein
MARLIPLKWRICSGWLPYGRRGAIGSVVVADAWEEAAENAKTKYIFTTKAQRKKKKQFEPQRHREKNN